MNSEFCRCRKPPITSYYFRHSRSRFAGVRTYDPHTKSDEKPWNAIPSSTVEDDDGRTDGRTEILWEKEEERRKIKI